MSATPVPPGWKTLPWSDMRDLHPAAVAALDQAVALVTNSTPRCCPHPHADLWLVSSRHLSCGLLCYKCFWDYPLAGVTAEHPCDRCGQGDINEEMDSFLPRLPTPTRVQPLLSSTVRTTAPVLLYGPGLCGPCGDRLLRSSPPDRCCPHAG